VQTAQKAQDFELYLVPLGAILGINVGLEGYTLSPQTASSMQGPPTSQGNKPAEINIFNPTR
jgi:hypothetical protein